MSWDIFVQDMPAGIRSIEEISPDFRPKPLGLKRSELIATIKEVAPFADFSNPAWGHIDSDYSDIEVNLGENEVVDHFAFHVHVGDLSPVIIATILDRLGLRAFDTGGGSDSGMFDCETALKGMSICQAYRDQVIGKNAPFSIGPRQSSSLRGMPLSLLEKACAVIVIVGLLNFVALVVVANYLGGDAVNGKVENGRYYLFSNRVESGQKVYVEVSKSTFTYSKWHVYSNLLTFPLTMVAGFYGSRRYKERLKSLDLRF